MNNFQPFKVHFEVEGAQVTFFLLNNKSFFFHHLQFFGWRRLESGKGQRMKNPKKEKKVPLDVSNNYWRWRGTNKSWIGVPESLSLIISMLRHALGNEFEPWWWQTIVWTQKQNLHFLHDSIWFFWFDTIICLSNLSCELLNRKLKNKSWIRMGDLVLISSKLLTGVILSNSSLLINKFCAYTRPN